MLSQKKLSSSLFFITQNNAMSGITQCFISSIERKKRIIVLIDSSILKIIIELALIKKTGD